MNLHNLKPAEGSKKRRKTIGRGPGSGKGKCSGFGHKGAKARAGRGKGYGSGYEGGQTRSYMRLPKIKGWRNKLIRPLRIAEVKLGDLNIIPAGTDVNLEVLWQYGLVRKTDQGYKILGGGELKTALNFKRARATKPAVEAVKKAGGTIELVTTSNEESAAPAPKVEEKPEEKAEETEQGE
ncbi:MAG TPA: 50S ribosomal protein L15 [Caldisericia bacterium]|nr:50S ribosomal protein L15 [Caldisericia bacterium]HPF49298.1 50S ribosomal protein L15 [Caldisericia bacterium]HPI84022.1 50S ribosomal protein L15 [Caldisericia bacterium]HPQ93280.1 50S ribosomal protein L15 [Caldisericia bacterium]HRV75338.1 50S ribosomal protein L15 [Caldisericia bacterium]